MAVEERMPVAEGNLPMPAGTASGILAGHSKPSLPVAQQIEYLKSKGVSFQLCSEQDAVEYLARYNNYLRTTSYRVLFPRQIDGEHAGDYVGLDFANLILLSRFDRRLREALLLMSVDIEHFARVKVLRLCEKHGEDGYSIVADFFTDLARSERERMLDRLSARCGNGGQRDAYTGDLIAHYGVEGLPVWVLGEVLEFGPFLTFYRFCASRWGLSDMLQEHYVLKSVKSLRNACAHNSCIANGFRHAEGRTPYRTPTLITDALNAAGIGNSKSRKAKLSNPRIAQIAATLYAVSSFFESKSAISRHANRMADVRRFAESNASLVAPNDGILSFLDFIWKLVDAWLPESQYCW